MDRSDDWPRERGLVRQGGPKAAKSRHSTSSPRPPSPGAPVAAVAAEAAAAAVVAGPAAVAGHSRKSLWSSKAPHHWKTFRGVYGPWEVSERRRLKRDPSPGGSGTSPCEASEP